ncbi:hypothetical protein LX87_01013 [Larkinella arboricola]|uniref:Uncharacterized protein n=1 Tax=Larkinella arboricola TaxID=643671 RepID=A0A327XB87_LARAB|nr:hypothetical protein LX87_01013 [Larkinella arboricola]
MVILLRFYLLRFDHLKVLRGFALPDLQQVQTRANTHLLVAGRLEIGEIGY